MKISVVGSDEFPDHLVELKGWFEDEWGKVDDIEGQDRGIPLPEPLLAFESNERLVGGLAFTRARSPGRIDREAVWINAVFVLPAYRDMGIASTLISHAEGAARRAHIEKLYVYTDNPGLYKRLGWQEQPCNERDCVLSKLLWAGWLSARCRPEDKP